MKYLGNSKSVAHVWYPHLQDTACTMWSTGGLKQESYTVQDNLQGNQRICSNCVRNMQKSEKRPASGPKPKLRKKKKNHRLPFVEWLSAKIKHLGDDEFDKLLTFMESEAERRLQRGVDTPE